VIVLVTVPLAVHKRIACLDVLAAPVVVVRVTSASEEMVVVPATAVSKRLVISSLTTVPHVLASVPVTGLARPRRVV